MKKVIWSIVLSWVCLAFAAAGIGTRDAVSACDGKVYKKGDKIISIKRLENSFITILKQFRDWLAIIFGRLLMEEMESCIWGMCIMDSVCCLLKIKK